LILFYFFLPARFQWRSAKGEHVADQRHFPLDWRKSVSKDMTFFEGNKYFKQNTGRGGS